MWLSAWLHHAAQGREMLAAKHLPGMLRKLHVHRWVQKPTI